MTHSQQHLRATCLQWQLPGWCSTCTINAAPASAAVQRNRAGRSACTTDGECHTETAVQHSSSRHGISWCTTYAAPPAPWSQPTGCSTAATAHIAVAVMIPVLPAHCAVHRAISSKPPGHSTCLVDCLQPTQAPYGPHSSLLAL